MKFPLQLLILRKQATRSSITPLIQFHASSWKIWISSIFIFFRFFKKKLFVLFSFFSSQLFIFCDISSSFSWEVEDFFLFLVEFLSIWWFLNKSKRVRQQQIVFATLTARIATSTEVLLLNFSSLACFKWRLFPYEREDFRTSNWNFHWKIALFLPTVSKSSHFSIWNDDWSLLWMYRIQLKSIQIWRLWILMSLVGVLLSFQKET